MKANKGRLQGDGSEQGEGHDNVCTLWQEYLEHV